MKKLSFFHTPFFIILKQNNYIMMWKLGLHFVIINKFLKLRT